jgi:hypothetical protein
MDFVISDTRICGSKLFPHSTMSSSSQNATTAGPASSGGSSLAASSTVPASVTTANPAVSSGGGSLTASNSNPTPHAMISSSGTSREGDLASSNSMDAGLTSGSAFSRVECLPTGDAKPFTWDVADNLVEYEDHDHHFLVPFPSRVEWMLSHTATVESTGMFCVL